MAAKISTNKVVNDLDLVIAAWAANPSFSMGKEITLEAVKATRADLATGETDITAEETTLTRMRNDHAALTDKGSDTVTRIRSAMRGVFGPDSTQYEQAGGTRRSERKRPTRKAAVAKA